ncbi:hypothetical protein PL263_19605 [Methylomonas sp. EFPC3]|uniref:hypothetical protein n=1 Tax=Methylomonas sp. EFPC3 TaxID=3021710 RepID=UPI002417E540|nr:hypothetical protein [Methylomonas sp. EFPC3]WFP50284.1 hypothetical protein PL263_19605 [Methylomonas sp. EFPC3]
MQTRILHYAALVCSICLTACSAKGYRGPELPDNQVATIELKAPALSKVPLFWVFPLNMLLWFSEHWNETSWGPNIFVGRIELDDPDTGTWDVNASNKVKLDRFSKVYVLPGLRSVRTMETAIVEKKVAGDTTSQTGSCECKEQEFNNQKQKVCEKKTTSSTPYVITARDTTCTLLFHAVAGETYQAFNRNGRLKLQHQDGKIDHDVVCESQDRISRVNEPGISSSPCSP